jgi:hypothetical protein
LVTVNDNDEKIKNFNSWRDSVIAKYSTQIFELEKANMEQSTSQLNTELENLSFNLFDKFSNSVFNLTLNGSQFLNIAKS